VVSWLEVSDLCRLILFALEHEAISGIYNAAAPAPVTNKELMKTIAKVKGGISIPIHVPAFLLRILLGEMSNEVLKSCTMSAEKIRKAGFAFNHPDITSAVRNILAKK
jgi:NAD dependent epimerase/dehydratase family enzyme